MIVGIVGSEAKKFTDATQRLARNEIRRLLLRPGVTAVSSGHCHLGGIDIWAEDEADRLGLEKFIYPPADHSWNLGYKPRNIQIAVASDEVWCITVKELPAEYSGMKFPLCYHCGTTDHVKSGGCWTTKYARGLGKLGRTIVIGEPE